MLQIINIKYITILTQLAVISVKSELINIIEDLVPCEFVSTKENNFNKFGDIILSESAPCWTTRKEYMLQPGSIIEFQLRTYSINNLILIEAHDNDTVHIANTVLNFQNVNWMFHHLIIGDSGGLAFVSKCYIFILFLYYLYFVK